jgi:hypothetical protein
MLDQDSAPLLPRDLGEGLRLRAATPADADALCDFNGRIHGSHETGEPDEAVRIITRDLISGGHPCTQADDFTLVEDARTSQIVSSLVLIGQTWSYAGIPFGVGRVELVGTLPEYRRRGLILAQMDVLHARSAARGQLMQTITGIPNYYRQFGYEMAMHLGGGRSCYRSRVPALKAGQAEPYRLRPATLDDVPLLRRIYAYASRRYLISCRYDDTVLRFELTARHPRSECRAEMQIIETLSGEPVGYLATRPTLERGNLVAPGYELAPGVSWLAVTPTVLRHLTTMADALVTSTPGTAWQALSFPFGTAHPLYEVAGSCLTPPGAPYAWYVRVANLPAFLWRIAPALEERLAGSLAAGHSGELRLSFYRSGLRLAFQAGKLTVAEAWNPLGGESPAALFPDLTFLKLLTGYQSLDEIRAGYPDASARSDEAEYLLGVLFPKGLPPIWFIE